MTKHKTDTNSDGLIDMMELIAFITRRKPTQQTSPNPKQKTSGFAEKNINKGA